MPWPACMCRRLGAGRSDGARTIRRCGSAARCRVVDRRIRARGQVEVDANALPVHPCTRILLLSAAARDRVGAADHGQSAEAAVGVAHRRGGAESRVGRADHPRARRRGSRAPPHVARVRTLGRHHRRSGGDRGRAAARAGAPAQATRRGVPGCPAGIGQRARRPDSRQERDRLDHRARNVLSLPSPVYPAAQKDIGREVPNWAARLGILVVFNVVIFLLVGGVPHRVPGLTHPNPPLCRHHEREAARARAADRCGRRRGGPLRGRPGVAALERALRTRCRRRSRPRTRPAGAARRRTWGRTGTRSPLRRSPR